MTALFAPFVTTLAITGMLAALVQWLQVRERISTEHRREWQERLVAQQIQQTTDAVHSMRRHTGRLAASLQQQGFLIMPVNPPVSRWRRVYRWLAARPRVRQAAYAVFMVAAVCTYWQAVLGALILVVPLLGAVLGIRALVYRRMDRRARERGLVERADGAALWWLWTGEHVAVVTDVERDRMQAWLLAEQRWLTPWISEQAPSVHDPIAVWQAAVHRNAIQLGQNLPLAAIQLASHAELIQLHDDQMKTNRVGTMPNMVIPRQADPS